MEGGRAVGVDRFGVCAVASGRTSGFSLLLWSAGKGVIAGVRDGLVWSGRVGLLVLVLLFTL